MKKANTDKDIIERVNQIELSLIERLNCIEDELNRRKETFDFVNDGLQAYRKSVEKELQLSAPDNPINIWHKRIREDKELRHPHKKIMETLLGQYDYQQQTFNKMHFSKLIKESRVGKNKAGEYLAVLQNKKYITKEKTPYRTHFCVYGY